MKICFLCFITVLFLSGCVIVPSKYDLSDIQDANVGSWLLAWINAKVKPLLHSSNWIETARSFIEKNNISSPSDISIALQSVAHYIYDYKDVWLDLPQFLDQNGGDCEDWSIATIRILQILGKNSYLVISFDGKTALSHAFVMYSENGYFHVFTPYKFLEEKFSSLKDAVKRINQLFGFNLGTYISVKFPKCSFPQD